MATSAFRLLDYDCIGLDLDNTLCQYKVEAMMRAEYEELCTYVVERRGRPQHSLRSYTEIQHFLARGIIHDIARGNFLKVDRECRVLRATHGTRLLSPSQVAAVYGGERLWDRLRGFADNLKELREGDSLRIYKDFFDIPALAVSAQLVDAHDRAGGGRDYAAIYDDVRSGLIALYHRKHFRLDMGGFFPRLKQDTGAFMYRCSDSVKDWLAQLKNERITFLITGSHVDFASHTASFILGADWRSYFDVVVCFAQKPGFFTERRGFYTLRDGVEEEEIRGDQLTAGNVYSQGNWRDLHGLLRRLSGKKDIRCVYMGDNLSQDVFSPARHGGCDTVAVIEELATERLGPPVRPPTSLRYSPVWGSLFTDDVPGRGQTDTLWGRIIAQYGQVTIPGITSLAQYPINHSFDRAKWQAQWQHR